MSFAHIFRRSLRVAIVAGLAGSGFAFAQSQPAAPRTVRILANWFAQPDQAGYWQAQQADLGRAAGVRISVLQGGPKIQTIPQVASGQAEFGIGNADDVLLARLRGAPVRAVFAPLDHVPYTFVYHADPSVKQISDLKGRTFAVSLGAAYWEWTKRHYQLANVREIPVTGDLSLFRNDPRMVQQGYSLFLPARMKEAGIAVEQFKLDQLGYRPYSVLFTTDEMIAKHPEVVRATVAAVRQGWNQYVRNPSGLRDYILHMNPQLSSAVYEAANKELVETLIPHELSQLGCMRAARWQELANQLRSAGFLPGNFDARKGYDLAFVPGCLQ